MLSYDLICYGSNLQSVIPAIVASRAGLSVGVIAPETVTGGMWTGGLGITDAVPTKNWWGVTEELIDAVKALTGWTNDRLSWNNAPSIAQGRLDALVSAEANLTLHLGVTLLSVERTQSVSTPGLDVSRHSERGNLIKSVITSVGEFEAPLWIDGSYTGELMCLAGVPHDLGREPSSLYSEPVAGASPSRAERAWRLTDVDGSLIRFAQFRPREAKGQADRKTMAGGFRHAITNDPNNRIPFSAPPSYDRRDFLQEIRFAQENGVDAFTRDIGFFLRRALYDDVEAEQHLTDYENLSQNGRETAWHSFVSQAEIDSSPGKFMTNGSDIVGPLAWEYTTASQPRRAEILEQLAYREAGRFYTLANDTDVPQSVRDSFSQFGYCADEFQTHYLSVPGFPHEYYHRQGRRLRGRDRIDAWDALYQANWPEQIAFGGYFVDSKAKTQFVEPEGATVREGDYGEQHFTTSDGIEIEWESAKYFGVPMGAVIPPTGVCDNLAVTWAISASDVAFTSIRLEPFLSAVAESVGHMVVAAHQSDVVLNQLSYAQVRERLDGAGAKLFRYIDGEDA